MAAIFYLYVVSPPGVPLAGAAHVMEIPYLFGFTHTLNGTVLQFSYTFSYDDYTVSNDVMTMWTNFAKYG